MAIMTLPTEATPQGSGVTKLPEKADASVQAHKDPSSWPNDIGASITHV